jgi:hypothetical protein
MFSFQLLSFTYLAIHYSLDILPIDITQSELLTPLLKINKYT